MDEVTVSGKTYISSKRASELCGYTQDYVGQLARAGLIEAQRIAGLWYVILESLQGYKAKADTFKPTPPPYAGEVVVDSIVTLEGKDYVSASRAAKLTGYNQDYVGQLARGGKVISRQVGNRWYIDRDALLAHKSEKDRLLAAVQAESVGLKRATSSLSITPQSVDHASSSLMSYSADDRDLQPLPRRDSTNEDLLPLEVKEDWQEDKVGSKIPIRVIQNPLSINARAQYYATLRGVNTVSLPGKTIFKGPILASVLTIVIVLSLGFASFRNQSVYAVTGKHMGAFGLSASAASTIGGIGDLVERLVTRELVYRRSDTF